MSLRQRENFNEVCPPPSPPARIRHLEFNDVRAGRLVAESIHASLASAAEYLGKALVRSRELLEIAAPQAPFTVSGSHVFKVVVMPIPGRAFDCDIAGVLLRREVTDVALVVPAREKNDEDDDVIVQWFVEQEAAAKQSEQNPVESVQFEEDDEDVMLTLRSGSVLTRSWRGGGTMRQR